MTESILVLNVNDHEATRYLYTQMLKRGGHRVVEAATGNEALALVAKHRPDLVLLDVRLPDISGIEVCRAIKAHPESTSTLVVHTSATFASSDRRVEGLDSGADAYLTQPVEALELLATIRALVRRQEAEAGERRIGRKLHKTFDAIKDPVVIIDDGGKVVESNHAAQVLLREAQVLPAGRQIDAVLRSVVKPSDMHALVVSARSDRQELEVDALGRVYRISVDPITEDDGRYEGAAVMLSDITDSRRLIDEHRRRAEELSEESQRKDEFLGMLAHELRNPLNAISAANTLLERTSTSEANTSRLTNVIHRQTRGLARMVDDLLEVSRITRGKIELRRTPTELGAIVRHALQSTQTVLDARKQRLVLSLPEAPLRLEGDDLRLEQVIINLVGNASKFSEPGSSIEVTVTEKIDRERFAEIRVKDSGIGVPIPMLEKIFDPFVQVDPTLARSLGGLGIGLSLVKSLVGLHGGTVRAESAGSGRGTEIVVVLPSLPPAPSVAAAESAPQKPAAEALSVLVIEDNDDARELFETWLQLLGHTVQSAGDGKTGCHLALSMQADIAFVDIGLPEMDGYEIAKSVRAAGKTTYLVAVTGYGRPEDRARALDAGFDDHIVKPLDEHALELVLRRRIERHAGANRAAAPTQRASQ